MASDWYYREKKQPRGPFSAEKLLEKLRAGEISGQTSVRQGKRGKWVKATEAETLLAGEKPQQPAGPTPVAAAATSQAPGDRPSAEPPAKTTPPSPRPHRLALVLGTAALIVAIAALALAGWGVVVVLRERRVERANQRVARSIDVARVCLDTGDAAAAEQALRAGLAEPLATDKTLAQTMLEVVVRRREADGLLGSAGKAIESDQVAAAIPFLEAYLAHPGAAENQEARILLGDARAALSDVRARRLLRDVTEPQLAGLDDGKLPDEIRHHDRHLAKAQLHSLRRNLPVERLRREVAAKELAVGRHNALQKRQQREAEFQRLAATTATVDGDAAAIGESIRVLKRAIRKRENELPGLEAEEEKEVLDQIQVLGETASRLTAVLVDQAANTGPLLSTETKLRRLERARAAQLELAKDAVFGRARVPKDNPQAIQWTAEVAGSRILHGIPASVGPYVRYVLEQYDDVPVPGCSGHTGRQVMAEILAAELQRLVAAGAGEGIQELEKNIKAVLQPLSDEERQLLDEIKAQQNRINSARRELMLIGRP